MVDPGEPVSASTGEALREQMRLGEPEIVRRKELLNLTDAEIRSLVGCRPVIARSADRIVADFYEVQTAIPEVAAVIRDDATLRHLQGVMKDYVIELFDGLYDAAYVSRRIRIGAVHKRIGVEPKFYLAANLTLKSVLVSALKRGGIGPNDLTVIGPALEKILTFDITLIFDTYVRMLLSEVEMARDRIEKHAAALETTVAERTRQLEAMARQDALTGLFTQRAFWEFLRRDLVQAERSRSPLSLVFFDVDDFKAVNDRLGHLAGDDVLRRIGDALKRHCRDVDVPCRYGGDEFCVVLPSCTAAEAEAAFRRVIDELRSNQDEFSFSVGIVQTGPHAYVTGDALVRRADELMYEAKKEPGFQIRS